MSLAIAALASLAWGACFAAPTPHPEDDAMLSGGDPAYRDAGSDLAGADWGATSPPNGDVDAGFGADAGAESQDVLDTSLAVDAAAGCGGELADGMDCADVDDTAEGDAVQGDAPEGEDVGPGVDASEAEAEDDGGA